MSTEDSKPTTAAPVVAKLSATEYLEQHKLNDQFVGMTKELIDVQPSDPIQYMFEMLGKKLLAKGESVSDEKPATAADDEHPPEAHGSLALLAHLMKKDLKVMDSPASPATTSGSPTTPSASAAAAEPSKNTSDTAAAAAPEEKKAEKPKAGDANLELGTFKDDEITLVADGEKVEFWGKNRPNGWLSNFATAPFEVDGVHFKTNEHFFQASKFKGSEKDFLEIAALPAAKDAIKAGRDRSRPLRKDWEEVKVDVMKVGIHAKFTQNENFKQALLSTESRELVEHSPVDKWWGDGGDGSGKNMLGQLLNELRESLKKNPSE